MTALNENLPVNLSLINDDRPLVLEQVLRVLPGRRATYLGRFGDQAAIVKCFSGGHQNSQADFSHELSGITALRQAGISTPALLCEGRLVEGDYCVITEYQADSVALDRLLAASVPATDGYGDNSEVNLAGRALGQALRALHGAGLMQKDAHLGNFLYREDSVCVIDGAEIVSSGRLFSSRRQLQNLALVLAQLPVYQGGFAEALLRGYGGQFLPRQISHALGRQRRRRERKYMRKTLRNCSEFEATHEFRLRQVVRRDQQGNQGLQAVLADLDGAIAAGEPLKLGNSATLVKIASAGRWLVIKRYNIKSFGHRLKRLLRVTRAARSWQNGYRLSMWGLATPLPLALVEHRYGPLRGKSYLICEYSSLIDCQEYRQSQPEEADRDEALARALSTMVASMKILGLSHGDLKASNLKFNGYLLQLLDLDSLTRWRTVRQLERATHLDCQRLLRNWKDAPPFAEQLGQRLEEQLAESDRQTGFINP